MKNIFIFSLCVLLHVCVLLGQSSNRVTWEMETDGAPIKKGKTITLTFKGKIPAGFHVYAAEQPSKSVLPLTIKLGERASGIALGALKEEGKKEEIFDEVFNAPIAQFSDEITLHQTIKMKSKRVNISGILYYQICNESFCVPEKFEFSLPKK